MGRYQINRPSFWVLDKSFHFPEALMMLASIFLSIFGEHQRYFQSDEIRIFAS